MPYKRTRSRTPGRGFKRTRRQLFRQPAMRKRRRFPRQTTRLVKAITLKMSEPKRKDVSLQFTSNGQFAHDALYECVLNTTDQGNTTVPTRLIASGGQSARVGDEVYSTGFMVRGSFGIPFDRRNTIVKIWLVEYNSNQGTPTNQAQWYRDTTGNNMIDPINNDRFPSAKLLKVLRCKARDLYVERGEVTDTGSIQQLYYNIWIPFKRKLHYASASELPPISGSKERFSLIATAYDTSSTITTDTVVVDHRQSVTWYYKDP